MDSEFVKMYHFPKILFDRISVPQIFLRIKEDIGIKFPRKMVRCQIFYVSRKVKEYRARSWE
jgi:hypothetical protein